MRLVILIQKYVLYAKESLLALVMMVYFKFSNMKVKHPIKNIEKEVMNQCSLNSNDGNVQTFYRKMLLSDINRILKAKKIQNIYLNSNQSLCIFLCDDVIRVDLKSWNLNKENILDKATRRSDITSPS